MEEKPPEDKYDVILLHDVIEHIPIDEFKELVNKLIKLKHDKTEMMIGVTFGKTYQHPMHFNTSEEYRKEINRLIENK